MRINVGVGSAAVLAVTMLLGTAASAQEMAICTPGVSNLMGIGVSSQKNVPYTATVKATFEQKLPDGNTIRGVTVVHQARDSAGKTRSEMIQGCFRGEDGQTRMQVNVGVFDPQERSTMHWDTGGPLLKVAHIFRPSDAPASIKRTPEELAEMQKWSRTLRSSANEFNHEKLGTKNIAGVEASGTRSTRTVPSGEEGNDLPLLTINEHWEALNLGITLLQIDEDPRRGKWTSEVIELTRGEPDPALFAPPQGYTVEEQKTVITNVSPATP